MSLTCAVTVCVELEADQSYVLIPSTFRPGYEGYLSHFPHIPTKARSPATLQDLRALDLHRQVLPHPLRASDRRIAGYLAADGTLMCSYS
jgi:hypothetical protein